MAVAALVVSVLSVVVAAAAVIFGRQQAQAAREAVNHAEIAAEAAQRSADLAEVVEAGRHYGWRIEPRIQSVIGPESVYVLRNVGTVNARNVSLAGDFRDIGFNRDRTPVDIAAGQAHFFSTVQVDERGGEVHITWTPDLPGAQPITWTEAPPIGHYRPR